MCLWKCISVCVYMFMHTRICQIYLFSSALLIPGPCSPSSFSVFFFYDNKKPGSHYLQWIFLLSSPLVSTHLPPPTENSVPDTTVFTSVMPFRGSTSARGQGGEASYKAGPLTSCTPPPGSIGPNPNPNSLYNLSYDIVQCTLLIYIFVMNSWFLIS